MIAIDNQERDASVGAHIDVGTGRRGRVREIEWLSDEPYTMEWADEPLSGPHDGTSLAYVVETTRDVADHPPLGEEKRGGGGGRSRSRRRIDWPKYDQYARIIGLDYSSDHYIRGHREQVRGLRWRYHHRWTHRNGAPPVGDVARAITNSTTRIALSGVTRAAIVTLDIDAHDIPPANFLVDRDEAQYRRELADACTQAFAAIERELPDLPWIVESSGRGMHAHVLLDTRANLGALRSIADALGTIVERAVAGSTAKVEVFPKIERSGARYCAAPLTGSARLLDPADLSRKLHRTRAEDLAYFVSRPRASAKLLMADLSAKVGAARPDRSRATSPRRPVPTSMVAPRPSTSAIAEKLRGASYAEACEDLIDHGIDDDDSYDAARKLAFLMVSALGMSPETARRIFSAYVALPIHRATHCKTKQGREQLDLVFASCVRHQLNGIEDGRVKPGKMNADDINRKLLALIGVDVGVESRKRASNEDRKTKIGRPVPERNPYVSNASKRRSQLRGIIRQEAQPACSATPSTSTPTIARAKTRSSSDHGRRSPRPTAHKSGCASSPPTSRQRSPGPTAPCASRSKRSDLDHLIQDWGPS